jgi:hypothetical protein
MGFKNKQGKHSTQLNIQDVNQGHMVFLSLLLFPCFNVFNKDTKEMFYL